MATMPAIPGGDSPGAPGGWEPGETITLLRSLSELLVFWSWMVFMSPNSNHPEESRIL